VSILKKFNKAKAIGNGNYFLPGRGEVLVSDVKVKDTFKEPYRFILELYTLKSFPVKPDVEPNAPGSSWCVQEPLTTRSGAMDRAKGLIALMLGKNNASDDELTEEFKRICRLDEDGHTVADSGPCPIRGLKLAYDTMDKEIQGGVNRGKIMTLPRFTLIKETPEQWAKNAAEMDD